MKCIDSICLSEVKKTPKNINVEQLIFDYRIEPTFWTPQAIFFCCVFEMFSTRSKKENKLPSIVGVNTDAELSGGGSLAFSSVVLDEQRLNQRGKLVEGAELT